MRGKEERGENRRKEKGMVKKRVNKRRELEEKEVKGRKELDETEKQSKEGLGG